MGGIHPQHLGLQGSQFCSGSIGRFWGTQVVHPGTAAAPLVAEEGLVGFQPRLLDQWAPYQCSWPGGSLLVILLVVLP